MIIRSNCYQLALTVFRLECPMPLKESERLQPFRVPDCAGDISVKIRFAPAAEIGAPIGYTCMENQDGSVALWVDAGKYPALSDWQVFTMLPLAGLLLRNHTLALHASMILFQGKAILFSGPSRIGKSTQAALWESCRGAEIINGDRALVYFREDGAWAGGYYKSGTSGICKNKTAPIGAIVLLDQGLENMVTIPRRLHAFHRLLSQCAYDPENRRELELVTQSLARLLTDTKVLHLTCRKDQSAVTELENYL